MRDLSCIAESCRLRLIFDGDVVSLALSIDATIEDIARILGGIPGRRYGDPVAIDVTLAKPTRGRREFSRSIGKWPRIVGSQYLAIERLVSVHRSSKECERVD